ncbi:glycine betaine/proline transport system permease protein [Arthrobacter sp. CAN_A212]|uniref:ABC transporter permease n=1 Tax=unclassified Arthrobacter TaxID=235627 RepID=UPI0018C8EA5C|nr:ABC transporter permease subunit [Arthrobacter sp. CAN_C5]MBP2218379.1 glycine betaine/proline transport system permease protein [Arthrobacter sp. CAN_C5]
MSLTTSRTDGEIVPRIPVGEGIETVFDWVDDTLGSFFTSVRDVILGATDGLADALNTPAPLVMVILFSLLALLVKDWKFALVAFVGLVFVIGVDQWENAMTTLALVLIATFIALVIAIPLGVVAAKSDSMSNAIRPVMDLMQTMPAFVWLVPVVTLFSIGVAGGVVATVIFALPPGVRLTELGIRQVDSEVVEAGHAFGSTPGQILRGIQLPLALPTIMAGVNQVIMLALSMAVIAGLVGAGGLGGAVTSSISQLDIGLGFEAGLSVVVLAIFLDRATAGVGDGRSDRDRRLMRGLARIFGRPGAKPVPQTTTS